MSLTRPQPPPAKTRPLITTDAWSSLVAELARTEADVAGQRSWDGIIRIPSADPARRLRALRDLHDVVVVDDTPGVAAIGRRVTIAEEDGSVESYALVLPGDGDPALGWISVDSPLGSAVVGARTGDVVTVNAPSGARPVRLVEVA